MVGMETLMADNWIIDTDIILKQNTIYLSKLFIVLMINNQDIFSKLFWRHK